MEKNYAISFVRVLAMLSIIAGHWCTYKGINTYQLGGVGVEVFLLISGYLYGNKRIYAVKSWMISRIQRVLIPFWITIVIYIIISVLITHTSVGKTILIYIINLQGIDRIFYNLKWPSIPGISQTWFLTVLFLCKRQIKRV